MSINIKFRELSDTLTTLESRLSFCQNQAASLIPRFEEMRGLIERDFQTLGENAMSLLPRVTRSLIDARQQWEDLINRLNSSVINQEFSQKIHAICEVSETLQMTDNQFDVFRRSREGLYCSSTCFRN